MTPAFGVNPDGGEVPRLRRASGKLSRCEGWEPIAQQLRDPPLSEHARFWCIGWEEGRHTPPLIVYEHKPAPERMEEVEPL